jgi:hypothetical protein
MARLVGVIELRNAVKGDEILLLRSELPVTPSKGKVFTFNGWILKFVSDMQVGWLCVVLSKV